MLSVLLKKNLNERESISVHYSDLYASKLQCIEKCSNILRKDWEVFKSGLIGAVNDKAERKPPDIERLNISHKDIRLQKNSLHNTHFIRPSLPSFFMCPMGAAKDFFPLFLD